MIDFSSISHGITSNMGGIGGSIGGIVIAILIFYIIFNFMPKYKEGRAERAIINRAGKTYQDFWTKYQQARAWQKKKKAEAKAAEEQARDRENEDLAEEEAEGGKKSKSDKKAEDTLDDVEDTEQDEDQVEDDTDVIDREVVAAAAALENATEDTMAEIEEMGQAEEVEAKETVQITALFNRIRGMNKFNKIDSKAAEYLKEYFQSLDKHIELEIEAESKNEDSHKGLVEKTRASLGEYTEVIKNIRKESSKLDKDAKREKKDFKKEIRDLMKLINDKGKELNEQRKEGKNPNLIIQLERELAVLHKNHDNLKSLDSTLETTLGNMKKEADTLRAISRGMYSQSKHHLDRFGGKLEKREKEIGKRIKPLQEKHSKISESIENFEGEKNIHGTVLKFSEEIEDYFNAYEELIKSNLEFQEEVKELIELFYLSIKKLRKFILLLVSLEESEKAIDNAMEAINTLMSVVFKEDVSGSLQKLNNKIKQSEAMLDYEKKLETELAAIEEHNQQQLMAASEKIKVVIDKNNKLIEENTALSEQEQSQLGNAMGTIVNKKITLNKNYASKITTLEQSLQKRNAQAAAAYKQAMAA